MKTITYLSMAMALGLLASAPVKAANDGGNMPVLDDSALFMRECGSIAPNIELVTRLLEESRVEPMFPDGQGVTPLMEVVKADFINDERLAVMRLLLNREVEADVIDPRTGHTPLTALLSQHHNDQALATAVKLLLDGRANVNMKSRNVKREILNDHVRHPRSKLSMKNSTPVSELLYNHIGRPKTREVLLSYNPTISDEENVWLQYMAAAQRRLEEKQAQIGAERQARAHQLARAQRQQEAKVEDDEQPGQGLQYAPYVAQHLAAVELQPGEEYAQVQPEPQSQQYDEHQVPLNADEDREKDGCIIG